MLCLLSTQSVHEVTTQFPHEVYLELERGAERPRQEHPPAGVLRFKGEAVTEGTATRELDVIEVRVYEAAKRVGLPIGGAGCVLDA